MQKKQALIGAGPSKEAEEKADCHTAPSKLHEERPHTQKSNYKKRKSPSKSLSKSHRSPARVPVASSIISAGMLFSDLKSSNHHPSFSQFHTAQTAMHDQHDQSHCSSNILNASNSKFAVTDIKNRVPQLNLDRYLEQERRASGEITSGRSQTRLPHTTRSISSITKEPKIASGTLAAKVKVGNIMRAAGSGMHLWANHQ